MKSTRAVVANAGMSGAWRVHDLMTKAEFSERVLSAALIIEAR